MGQSVETNVMNCIECGNKATESKVHRRGRDYYWCENCKKFVDIIRLNPDEEIKKIKGKWVIKDKKGIIRDWIGYGKNL